jgi:hypothetical protein
MYTSYVILCTANAWDSHHHQVCSICYIMSPSEVSDVEGSGLNPGCFLHLENIGKKRSREFQCNLNLQNITWLGLMSVSWQGWVMCECLCVCGLMEDMSVCLWAHLQHYWVNCKIKMLLRFCWLIWCRIPGDLWWNKQNYPLLHTK